MCGIAGIHQPGFDGLGDSDARDKVAAMNERMLHRGPDQGGIVASPGAVLGHRRLSIIDLATGNQPMVSPDGKVVLVFNGEIYNYLDLRRELQEAGRPFQTRSDTEVLLQGYLHWGVELLPRLRGMFAFAIADSVNRTLFAARDPVGKKPFYFQCHAGEEGRLVFASELDALLAGLSRSPGLSPQGISLYRTLGYIPAPHTIYAGIEKLKAGEALLHGPEGLRRWTYWRLPAKTQPSSYRNQEEWIGALDDLLFQAVKRRLISEVPLGALLSGGIDSNLVVAEMARAQGKGIKTITAGFDAKSKMAGIRDERGIAAKAAAHYGCDHHEVVIPQSGFELLPTLARHTGEPLADSSLLSTYLVCREARKHVTVALTGDGGDEPFGGYSFRYLPHLLEARIRSLLPSGLLRPAMALMASVWPRGGWLPRPLRLSTLFRNLAHTPVQAFLLDQAPRWPKSLGGGSRPEDEKEAFGLVEELAAEAKGLDGLNRMLYIDARLYMCENVLVKADRMSMANSIELRSPLLDQDLLEWAYHFPPEWKIRDGVCKYPLRALAKARVWPGLFDQPKTGFALPVDTFLRGSWRGPAENILMRSELSDTLGVDRSGLKKAWSEFLKGDDLPGQLLWSLIMFGSWQNHR